MFHDIAYDLATRTKISLAMGLVTMDEVRKRAEKIAAFLPEGQDRTCYAETWIGLVTR